MNQQEEQAIVISCAYNAQYFRLLENKRTRITIGTLNLIEFQQSNRYFININQFAQNITNDTPFVYFYTLNGMTLLFPHLELGLNAIFIPQSQSMANFHQALLVICQLVHYEQAIQNEQFKEAIDQHCNDIQGNPLENPKDPQQYIAEGGHYIKQGFMQLGSMLSSGINKSGEYISSKIAQGEEVQVNEENKNKFNEAKDQIGSAFKLTGNYLGQLFKPVINKTKEYTNEISQKIDTSNNEFLKSSKEFSIATWGAAGTAFEGLGEALSQVGESLGKNTKSIVQKKYGNEFTQTYLGEVPVQQANNQEFHQSLIEEEFPLELQDQQQIEEINQNDELDQQKQ